LLKAIGRLAFATGIANQWFGGNGMNISRHPHGRMIAGTTSNSLTLCPPVTTVRRVGSQELGLADVRVHP